jgi:hypothetical protein
MDLTLIQTLWKFEEWVNPDFVQQVKEETIERYVNTLEKIGKKVGFLELHSHLEELIPDDLESTKFQEIQIWYQEEKEELQKLRDLRVELEKKIKIIPNKRLIGFVDEGNDINIYDGIGKHLMKLGSVDKKSWSINWGTYQTLQQEHSSYITSSVRELKKRKWL